MRDTGRILSSLGYTYISWETPGSEPDFSDKRFMDIVEEFAEDPIGKEHLYRHQIEGLKALLEGKNIILRSGTGSGKTEVWILYTMLRYKKERGIKVLAVYPTIALANDQIRRIERYSKLIGLKNIQVDSVQKQRLVKEHGLPWLRKTLAAANIIVTNPAYLMHEVKKYAVSRAKSLFYTVFQSLDLLVVDELDFYDPRSLSLLLGIIKMLESFTDKKLQVVVLTATLENPEDLARYLEEVTGRKTAIIHGKPFMVPNKTYIAIGKDVEKLWNNLREVIRREAINTGDEDLRKASESYEYFYRKLYYVLGILEALGHDIPSPTIDLVEILGSYIGDEGVTLVFTRSIAKAEEIARRIKTIYGEDAPVATHHHLVPKKTREEIEEKARKGEINLIITPRTLSQGIDIGTVIRVVHVGLPDNVREYYQREGRKGRRRTIPYTETLIIPYTRWDRELLTRGVEVFKKWLGLGLEKTIIYPENLYLHLFTGVVKLKSPWMNKELSELEKKALESTGILKKKEIDQNLLDRVFNKLNFYEYAPPYGIKRYLVKDGREIPLEEIGHCDLVEKFQPGCIDYSENAVITELRRGRKSRIVSAVIEEPISWELFRRDDALSQVLEEYYYQKIKWREEPNIIRDFYNGRITCEELCVVYVPEDGFGRYRKVPNRCIWRIKSSRPRVLWIKGKPHIYYDKKTIYVPKNGAGEYRDYTYGYKYDVDPRDDPELLRLGLAYLMIILRRRLGIPFETIMYDVIRIGENKYFSLHEPQSAGLIENINWLEFRRIVEEYEPDEIDEILLSEIDDIAYSTFITHEMNWDIVKQQVKRIIDYILLREKIEVYLGGKKLLIEKPSPALKLLSVQLLVEEIDSPTSIPYNIIGIAYYDGLESHGHLEMLPALPYIKPSDKMREIERTIVEKTLYDEYTVIVPSVESFLEQAKKAGLRTLSLLPRDRIIGIDTLARDAGIEPVSMNIIMRHAALETHRTDPSRAYEYLSRLKNDPGDRYASRVVEGYLEEEAVNQYLFFLVLRSLKKKK